MIGAFSGLRPTEMYNLTFHQPAEADLLQVGELMRLEAGSPVVGRTPGLDAARGAIARCCTRT
jgi:hypothetical protein